VTGSGLLIVDKPGGITSHQVVARARRALGTKKIGHAGTLDPMATGVMVLGVNKATRLLGHLTLASKTYEATIRLGQATITDDAEGDVTAAPGASGLTRERIEDAVAAYRGVISQVPSAVSAIKVDGRRAYARVRQGEDVQLAAREVTVDAFAVLAVRSASADGLDVVDVDVRVDCSSGTYIRALARDLGRDLGTGGHLTALRRTRVGPFTLADASWDADPAGPPPGALDLAEAAGRCFDVVEVDEAQARDVGFGRSLPIQVSADPTALVHEGRLLALYRPGGDGAVPVAVLV
jgi:tRNA pseudouridine55 synthase